MAMLLYCAPKTIAMHIEYASHHTKNKGVTIWAPMKNVERRISARLEGLLASNADPLNVRHSTAEVVKEAKLVHINAAGLANLAHQLQDNISANLLLNAAQFGHGETTPQRVFILDTVNFCFWTAKWELKWQVEYPAGVITDGWSALTACFDRALEEGVPILDANFLTSLSEADAQHLFRSNNQTIIPLFQERIMNLRQAGQVLKSRFGGDFAYLASEANYDAIKIVQLILAWFPSFRDTALSSGREVNFYKRAQICAYDLSLLPSSEITNLDYLTVFADYKLPQVLRHYDVVQYNPELARKVDNLVLLPPGSQEEIEIRAATIWSGELLAQELGVSPATTDNALWLMGGTLEPTAKPYHRTLTTNY